MGSNKSGGDLNPTKRPTSAAIWATACCPQFTPAGVWWNITVVDDPLACQVLDEIHQPPDTATESVAAICQRFADHGLDFVTQEDGVVRIRPVMLDEMGATP